ncbi:hypothetical protein F383_16364 [Gossypium arboreum]|uniref:Uncharacterized protein n=1 Tax=Gossypium arboreum TaxID=29729 RepID=A0A0B0P697_GOSAR|nr:hypothetical protein F383_24690 [Gossypium arboreum]KHG27327.1 hypothetical protein F383_16364 [Gossypium arboreum]
MAGHRDKLQVHGKHYILHTLARRNPSTWLSQI